MPLQGFGLFSFHTSSRMTAHGINVIWNRNNYDKNYTPMTFSDITRLEITCDVSHVVERIKVICNSHKYDKNCAPMTTGDVT